MLGFGFSTWEVTLKFPTKASIGLALRILLFSYDLEKITLSFKSISRIVMHPFTPFKKASVYEYLWMHKMAQIDGTGPLAG